MTSKLRVYLDTSVISALGDSRAPDRQQLTREFFARAGEFELFSSELTRDEMSKTRDEQRRLEMFAQLKGLQLLLVTAEAIELSGRYLAARAMPEGAPEDALHVAIAVTARQDILLSWNFKHLVNRRRRAMLDSVNSAMGLPPISILAPPEL
jgi:predicted nucleic acid-binding protein